MKQKSEREREMNGNEIITKWNKNGLGEGDKREEKVV